MKSIKLKNLIDESTLRTINEAETGLYVYASTPRDFQRLVKWLDSSNYYAEVNNRDYYAFFPESPSSYDALEGELNSEFNRYNISVRYESV